MSISKQRISSPLEAGRSILDAHNLPPQLTGALEYTSKRLARKRLHISLIVVRNEYQLPSSCSVTTPCETPISPPQTPEYSSSSPWGFTSPVAGLRQLVRRGTGSSASTSSSPSSSTSSSTSEAPVVSPTFPPPPTEPVSSPRRWILPLSPRSPLPLTPMTPHTPSSIATTMTTTTTSSPSASSHLFQTLEPLGICLVHTSLISPKDDKFMRATIAKAERKFHTRTGGLPTVTTASACGLNADLVRRSIQQNEILFSSEGLTLLGLDRLYSFKAALAAYTRSIITPSSQIPTPSSSPGISYCSISKMSSPTSTSATAESSRLEDAVDCLRRLVLSNGDRPVRKGDLYLSFDWMKVNQTALSDVERMYRRAYGGVERRGPFVVPPIMANAESERTIRDVDKKALGFVKIGTPPPPRTQTTPALKLNTNIATTQRLVRPKPKPIPQTSSSVTTIKIGMDSRTSEAKDANNTNNGSTQNYVEELMIRIDDWEIGSELGNTCDDHVEDGKRTVHPLRDGPLRPSMFWPYNDNALGASIDEMLSPCDTRQSQRLGPMTPNGYDDISPITRGEWGYLFKGDTWKPGRTAMTTVVETC